MVKPARQGVRRLKLHIRRRHLLIHIEELPSKPLHILVRQFLLLIQEIVNRHFAK